MAIARCAHDGCRHHSHAAPPARRPAGRLAVRRNQPHPDGKPHRGHRRRHDHHGRPVRSRTGGRHRGRPGRCDAPARPRRQPRPPGLRLLAPIRSARLAERDDAAAFAAMANAARTAARGGVTTVRDLGDRGYLSLGLREAARIRPVAADDRRRRPADHHARRALPLPGRRVGPAGVRAAVREHAERGVDVIKIMASGGNLTPGSRPELAQFGPDELRAAVDEAHRPVCRSPPTRTVRRPSSTPWRPGSTASSTSRS